MTEIKSFWIDSTPKLDDIKQAFELAKTDVAVSIRWYVKYNGSHERITTKEIIDEYTCEEYFEKCIPHIYGV